MTITITPERYRTDVDARARARAGNPYVYGGAFTTDPDDSCDCSALVFQTAAWIMGRTDWSGNRYGSTESARLHYQIVYDLGLRPMPAGGPPINSLMLVGFMHGGGGEYSHTACTIRGTDRPGGDVRFSPRGVDWESQGNGVFYYDGARAWNDPLFHDFWYLDAVLGAAGPVINEINSEYDRAKGWIGKRLDAVEQPAPDGEGKFIRCEGGSIYWHPKVNTAAAPGMRAIAVPNEVMGAWRRAGYERGPIGYPTRRHYTDNIGIIQGFQRGAVYRKHGTNGGVVHGKIGERYAAEKAEKGRLGYPLGDEQIFDGGRTQGFEHGDAYFHPSMVVEILDGP